jgi:hypothetical protein
VSGETNEREPHAGRLSDYLSLGVVARIYRRVLVDQVLLEARRTEKRARLLPARLVVYCVIALALFFGEAYEEVMRKMVGGLRFVAAWERAWKVPTASALCQARQRLGEEPLRQLFERAAAPLAMSSTIGAWLSHRWRLMAIDGVTLDVPDTAENEKEFGRPSSRTGQGGAFPEVRMVGLGECGTHAIVAADSYLSAITGNGISAPTSMGEVRWRVANRQAALVRVIEYQITDRPAAQPYRLITTITDWRQALSGDLAAAYHQRWEFEIALDEIETHQIAHTRVLRSKSPEMVRQEIWGILLAHYAIRALMVEAAHDADLDPDRLSFMDSLRVIRREADGSADFPPSQH